MKVAILTPEEISELIDSAVQRALLAKHPKPQETSTGPQWISIKDFRAEFNLSRTSIYKLINSKALRPQRLPGSRRIFFLRSDVARAMERVNK